VTALAILGLTVLATAGDWPKWLGPNGSGIGKETGLADKWPDDGPKKLWSVAAGAGYSSPVIAAGKVYLFSTVDKKDTLTCLTDEGKEVWSKSYAGGWTGSYAGTRATPTIEGDFIYTYGGAGDLACWKLADGSQVWNVNVLKQVEAPNLTWGLASSPVISGDWVLVQGGKNGAIAVAVNKKDGTIAWQGPKGLGSYAAVLPIEVGGAKQFVVFAGQNLVCLDNTGKQLWSEPWKTSWDVNAATPIYRDGQLFVTSGYNHGCMMLKLTDSKAEKLWEKKEPHSRFVAPILDGEYLYVNSEGALMCLHWPDGEVKWTSNDPALGVGGSFCRVGDKLFAMTETGTLELIQASPEGCKVISKVALFKGKDNWSMPVVSNGKLYVKGPAELICFDAK
jgi:hypothetical protein